MADIEFHKPHSLPVAEARALVQTMADSLSAEYGLSTAWQGDVLKFHRSGVDGRIQVTDAEIRLQLTLGLLFKAFKGKLLDRIEDGFDSLLSKSRPLSKKA